MKMSNLSYIIEEETAALSVASTDSEKPKLENSTINLPATKFEMAVSHDVVSNPKVDHSGKDSCMKTQICGF